MKFKFFARHGAAIAVAALLGTLAAAAPIFNEQGGPPRSVFLRLPPDGPQPSVSVDLAPAHDGTWRLRIDAERFTFTDLCVTDAEAIPVGHAHVMLNGVKVASAYYPVVDLGPLPPGDHDLTVVLRGQDHRALLGHHGLIKADAVIHVPEA